MSVQTSLFWLSGAAFFVVQLALLLFLLRQSRAGDPAVVAGGRLEIVWTLVPASLIAALALMLGGLTRGSWTDRDPLPDRAPPASILRWPDPRPHPGGDGVQRP